MNNNLQEDVSILLSKLKGNKDDMNKYHTLADSFYKAHNIIYDEFRREEPFSKTVENDFKYLLKQTEKEYKDLGDYKTNLLNKEDFKSYHKALLAYDKIATVVGGLKIIVKEIGRLRNRNIEKQKEAAMIQQDYDDMHGSIK